MTLRVCELFRSIQGEGLTMGIPTAFVRLAGCNLNCRWCDTRYARSGGEHMTLEDILAAVDEMECTHVCVTGGEPMLQAETPKLVDRLIDRGHFVTLETNGSIPLDVLSCSEALLISMDVKCPGSGEAGSIHLPNLEILASTDQLKFVIADRGDYDYALDFIAEHKPECNIIFTPVGGTDLRDLAEWVLADGLEVRVLPQLHKMIWGDARER